MDSAYFLKRFFFFAKQPLFLADPGSGLGNRQNQVQPSEAQNGWNCFGEEGTGFQFNDKAILTGAVPLEPPGATRAVGVWGENKSFFTVDGLEHTSLSGINGQESQEALKSILM